MFFKKSREKELRMICQVKKGNEESYLVGTAHLFPYSFRSSLFRYIENASTVLFEGPLDQENMARVVKAGLEVENPSHLFDEMDKQTILRVSEMLIPTCRIKSPFLFFNPRTLSTENPVYEMVKGMKPWLAFFAIWFNFLRRNGWQHSVDEEAYSIARETGKPVIFLETIEEQIKVLENLSHEKILYFLEQVDHWNAYAQKYVKCYLKGDLENLTPMWSRFPTRHGSVIGRRDRILYERMARYLKKGDAVAFVGAPHLRGIGQMLRADGFEIQGPPGTRS
ncbi:MAG: TraB/GumN family protein [Desulfobacteraceae bacterium]|jgi:uncharacterized protein YbaP (TraB family)